MIPGESIPSPWTPSNQLKPCISMDFEAECRTECVRVTTEAPTKVKRIDMNKGDSTIYRLQPLPPTSRLG